MKYICIHTINYTHTSYCVKGISTKGKLNLIVHGVFYLQGLYGKTKYFSSLHTSFHSKPCLIIIKPINDTKL